MNPYKNPTWWHKKMIPPGIALKPPSSGIGIKPNMISVATSLKPIKKIGNTTRQALGKEVITPRGMSTFEEAEPAYRYGYGARSKYGDEYPEWNDELEEHLRGEWSEIAPSRKQTWMQDRAFIRRAWDYDQDV